MGKTEKEKAKDKSKGKDKAGKKDQTPKILKAGAGAGKQKKKKWSKTKSKDKVNNTVFWTKPLWDKLLKDVISKESYITPSLISEKLKINVSLAREAISSLSEEQKLAPFGGDSHSKYCCYVKTPSFIVAVPTEADGKKQQQKGGEKKGKQQAKGKDAEATEA